MENYIYSPFKIACECCDELIEAQPAKERISYKRLLLQDLGLDDATEAANVTRGAGRSKLVEVLYKDIMSKSNADFDTIPQSRGDITKFQHYKNMSTAIDSLNQLLGDHANDNMVRMNDLHEAIIQERASFEFGYKVGIELLQYIYCTLVEALMDVINENIVNYVDYLKETQDIELPPSLKNKNKSRVDSAVDTFLSLRKKGEWKKLIDHYRREYTKRSLATAMIIGTVSVVGVVALLWAVRSLIYVYFYGAAKIDEKARAMSSYISAVSSTETDPKALRRQNKANRQLENVAAFIEAKILKDDQIAKKELQKADAAISKTALSGVSSSSEYDIELD